MDKEIQEVMLRFHNEVVNHRIKIEIDQPTFRYVRFRAEKSSTYWFDLITWPGCLCISGDMGTFVFSRVTDMFTFFRDCSGRKTPGALALNLPYWAEKVTAMDRNGKVKQYSFDILKERIDEIIQEAATTKAQRDAVQELLRSCEHESEEYARRAVYEFDEFQFLDFGEYDLTNFTVGYIWCCCAIVWGINEYDRVKSRTDPGGISDAV